MQQVPELVFLNCLPYRPDRTRGHDRNLRGTGAKPVEFNRLAASVSRELIEMGVRAVVAAGWAVRDDAARDFAETFYRSMLANETLRPRTQDGPRAHVRQVSPANTWGAYQAYGDPDYRLDPNAIRDSGPADGLVAVDEFVDAVRNVGATAEHDGASIAEAVKQLDELVKICPSGWLEQTEVQMAIGKAYGDLTSVRGRPRIPSELRWPVRATTSTTTLRAVEDLANYEARLRENADGAQKFRQLRLASTRGTCSPWPRQLSATPCSGVRSSAAPTPSTAPTRLRDGTGQRGRELPAAHTN